MCLFFLCFLGWIFTVFSLILPKKAVLLKNLVVMGIKDVDALQINHSLAHFMYFSENFVCTYKTMKTPNKCRRSRHAYLLHHMRFNELLYAEL